MKLAGNTWLPDGDTYFGPFFEASDVFEGQNLKAALMYVQNFGIAVDGGAHVGSWTRYMAKLFDHVYAYEPHPENFACLVCNVEGLGNVHAAKVALSDQEGATYLAAGNNGGSWHIANQGIEIVRAPLPDLGGLDFLKLDVEGFEEEALRGCAAQLAKYRPVVLIEERDLPHRKQDYGARKLLESLGYAERLRVRRDVIFTHERRA